LGRAAKEGGEGQAGVTNKPGGAGCVLSMIVVNALILGAFALSFAQGPYSSREQELWYRYGSIGFVLLGAILPALALVLGIDRSRAATTALTAWMVATLLAFTFYALLSSGGV
jgi:hypothetical protein